jgi:hypothetical protein
VGQQGHRGITLSRARHRAPRRIERAAAWMIDSMVLQAAALVLLVSMLSIDPVLNDRT